jgi:hypothetical protein
MADEELRRTWEDVKEALLFECLPTYLVTFGVSAELPLWPSCCGQKGEQQADVLEYYRLVNAEAVAVDCLLANGHFKHAMFLMEIFVSRLEILSETLERKINTI